MLLFFTGARIVCLGRTLKTLEEGHSVLMYEAFQRFSGEFPPGTDKNLIILGNQRADLPRYRPDGTIGLWGLADALFRAQLLPKYHHGMRQAWNHPTRNLPKVQQALYQRLLKAITTSNPALACERFGQALHTLQDTYTIGHTERENNADPFSPMVRLHYSPSQAHPFISPKDTVWADIQKNRLTPEAEAAILATLAAFDLWCKHWPASREEAQPEMTAFVQQYTPIRGQVFSPQ